MASLLLSSGAALVLRGLEAQAILAQKQRHVVMAFNCRSVSKGGEILIVVQHNDPCFASACVDQKHMYKVVGKVNFVSNRRWDEERLLKEGQAPDNSFPSSAEQLCQLRHDIGMATAADLQKMGKKYYVLWEVSLKCAIQHPCCVSKALPLIESFSGAGAAKPAHLQDLGDAREYDHRAWIDFKTKTV
eukprot:s1306_g8.t1